MTARRFLLFLLLGALGLFCSGCAGLKPDHLILGFEGEESETAGAHRQRMGSATVSARLVYDFKK